MSIKVLYRPRPVALMLGMVLAAAVGAAAFAQAPATPPAQSPATQAAPAAEASDAVALGAPMIASAALPRDLSPWGMFLNADIVVKTVMVGLIFASLVTWTVWLAKNLELWKATRNGRAALAVLNEARSLAEANTRLGPRQRAGGAAFAHRGARGADVAASRSRELEGARLVAA